MKVLVTGGSGLLGKYLSLTKPDNIEAFLTYYNGTPLWRQLDVTNKLSIYRLLSDFKFDAIIHTAGLGNVDFCERVPHISDLVNYEGTKNLIDALNETKQKPLFIHVSTNAVYSGNNPTYTEKDKLDPINKYGFSKKIAEEYIQARYDNWSIVRPFMLFGWPRTTGRGNWLKFILESSRDKKELNLIDDIIWQPTSAKFAAKVIWKLIEENKVRESYNLSQGEPMSLYRFSQLICEVWNLDCSFIKPISHKAFETVARRPLDTSYDISKLREFIEVPTVKKELEKIYV